MTLRLAFMAALAVPALTAGLPLRADTLDLAFMPPQVVAQDLCIPGASTPEDDLDIGLGDDDLTDELRLRYIRRDIRNLQAEDADRWFDFILTLIGWQAELDPEFAGTPALLARIALHIDAGRLDALRALDLIGQLRSGNAVLSSRSRMQLAQYYLNGIGVTQDTGYATGLIRDAAYNGHPDALLAIARMLLQGQEVAGWDAPLEMTVTLALGGMLGQMNADVCRHAERIAQEYLNGDVLTRNPEIALQWFRFGADLGGASAAWRVVEFHLEADAARKDNAEMLTYLSLAVARGITVDTVMAERIRAVAVADEATLRQIMGFNFSADTGRGRPSLSRFLQLSVNLDSDQADPDSVHLQYLTELTRFDTAPGWVFTALADEVLVRRGRWAGEAEALPLLEEAALRRDGPGARLLAEILIRYRDDPGQLNRAINLLAETVTRDGLMGSMQDLDGVYRCQVPDAPLLSQADYWARAYRATEAETVTISATDLIVLDPFKAPDAMARIQSQALRGDPQSLANWVQLVQINPLATEDAQRLWANRADGSVKALELFAELEFTLATNPAERDLAVELFRRVYLNNGVTTALDLSVALVEDNGRDPALAAEIVDYLTQAANRGEGASIRLLARLTGAEPEVYQTFATVIEERGDFLALMFAVPFVSLDMAGDYVDRAVSLMACGTKDVAELGDAAALMQSPDQIARWQRIGLAIDYGDVLAKLALSDRQMDDYDAGAAPGQVAVFARALAEGDVTAHRALYDLTANPDLPGYDPAAAADHLLALLAVTAEEPLVLDRYRTAGAEVRQAVDQRRDLTDVFARAAERGDIAAQRDYGLLLRQTATSVVDLRNAVRWLTEAAEGGDVTAMAELAQMLAIGMGTEPDRDAALTWAEQAARAGNQPAAVLAQGLTLMVVP